MIPFTLFHLEIKVMIAPDSNFCESYFVNSCIGGKIDN